MAIKYLSINNDSIDFSNIPKLDSDNIFAGVIISNNSQSVVQRLQNYDVFSNPSDNMQYWVIQSTDESGQYGVTKLKNYKDADGRQYFQIADCMYSDKDNYYMSGILIGHFNSHQYVCITTDIPSNSNDNQLATTQWVRSLLRRNGINLTS